jgi:3-methyladenine DNA glycosylase/8-oxoguanine DNA glycosylase
MELYYRVRKMFDLDTDFTQINVQLGADPLLKKGMSGGQVPRLPAAFEPFEFVIRAILGQQITVKAATTLAGRIAEASAAVCHGAPAGLLYFFPTAQELSATDISSIGITKIRQQTIQTVTDAVLDRRLSLSANLQFDNFAASFGALKGIGDWTVNYTAMRGLGMKDAFPAADLGIIKAMTRDEQKLSVKEINKSAEQWRPYRSYAALCLWNIPAESANQEE